MKMGKATKRSIGISLMLFIWIGAWSNPAKADPRIEYAGPAMTEEIQALFDGHFAEYLNSMKKHYDTDGDFRQAEVQGGIMVEQISLEGHDFFGMGYEFPLRLEGRTVGTVTVEQGMNEWEITGVSPIADLDRELGEAIERFPSAKAIRYVHDPSYRIRGFYTDMESPALFFDTRTQTVCIRPNKNHAERSPRSLRMVFYPLSPVLKSTYADTISAP